MTLKQLRYLIAIAEAGSFSGAARNAYIAQPALSRQIGMLESELEVQLLRRLHDGVDLTDAGRRLYEVARTVIQQIDSAKDELMSVRGNPHGRVSVALPVTTSALLLPRIIQRAKDKFPSIELVLRDGLSTEGGEAIELGKVDFGIVPNAEELDGVLAEPIFIEQLYWVGHQQVSGSGDTITLAEAAAQPLVMPPRFLHLRRRIEQAAMSAGVELNVCYEQQSALGITGLVESGLASTISNWPPIDERSHALARRIVAPEIVRTVSLAHSAHKPLTFAASCIQDLVRELLVEMVTCGHWKGQLIERAPCLPA